MAYISHTDQNGEPCYSMFPQISWSGKQKREEEGGKRIWYDEWEIEDKSVQSINVHYGYEDCWPREFTSSYQGYLKALPGGQYIKRARFEDYEEPLEVECADYKPPELFGTTPY